jgi:hypothetical protein
MRRYSGQDNGLAVTIHQLRKSFGQNQILPGIDLYIGPGEFCRPCGLQRLRQDASVEVTNGHFVRQILHHMGEPADRSELTSPTRESWVASARH